MKLLILAVVLPACTHVCHFDASVRLSAHPDRPYPAAAVSVRCDQIPVWSGLCDDATVTVQGDTRTVWCDGQPVRRLRKVSQ